MNALQKQVAAVRNIKAHMAHAESVAEKQLIHEELQEALMRLPLGTIEDLIVNYQALVSKADND